MRNRFLILFLLFLFPITFKAQIEKVIVETYYIADSADASDSTGGPLAIGSTTYRVYIDLKPGSKLKKIYGDANHTLKITSDSNFFNHTFRGQSFGFQFNNLNHLKENNSALDTWLTLGQVTKKIPKTYFGILKTQDTNGNLIAGTNNFQGLLANDSPAVGVPLTISDGLDTMAAIPTSASYGIIDVSSFDSTIFGQLKPSKQFISNNAGLQNSAGVTGVIADSNQVLVAQLTTKGTISFELNVEVIEPDGTGTKIVNYVANDSILLPNEKLNRYLKYPFVQICGCPDPNYIEYKADRDCDKSDSCKTLVVLGCMDTMACNYNPKANYNIQSLCCYPGYCNNRDISVVCPSISNTIGLTLFPNPAQDYINLQISSGNSTEIKYSIFDSFGIMVYEKNIGALSGNINEQVNLSNFNTGLYLVRVYIGSTIESKLFMKN